MTSNHFSGVSLGMLALAFTGCENGPVAEGQLPPRSECVIAVVHSDYRSSAISLLTRTGEPCAPDIIDSGSRPPGLLTALSGDVVLSGRGLVTGASTGKAEAAVALIDRYPAGTLTVVDPLTDAVTHQAALSPGYDGNPQDIISLDASTVLVSRLEPAPSGATTEPSGSDLAIFRLPPVTDATASGQLLGRMNLASIADDGFFAMPGRLAQVGTRVFIGLSHLAADFSAAGPGRVAYVDMPTSLDAPTLASWLADAQVTMVNLPGLENCTEIAPSPDEAGIWVVCSGSFRRGAQGQVARSGLAFIDASGAVKALFPANTLTSTTGEAAALGFTLAAVDARRAVVVALGDLVTKRPDRALLVTRSDDESEGTAAARVEVIHETGPHDLGDVLALIDEGAVLLADGNPETPHLVTVTIPEIGAVIAPGRALPLSSATGLPPRGIRYFRRP